MIWVETSLGENTQTEKSCVWTMVLTFSTAFRNIFGLHLMLAKSRDTARKSGQIFWMICPLICENELWFPSYVSKKMSRGENTQTETLINKFKKYKHGLSDHALEKSSGVLFRHYWERRISLLPVLSIADLAVSAPLAAVSANNEIPSAFCTGGEVICLQ